MAPKKAVKRARDNEDSDLSVPSESKGDGTAEKKPRKEKPSEVFYDFMIYLLYEHF